MRELSSRADSDRPADSGAAEERGVRGEEMKAGEEGCKDGG